ncbi:glycosyltransferase [Clostridium botulinum]|nr:glycosyltransferase [Clostridium botulinum]
MKIFIISGPYPTKENLTGGIFVTRRCEVLNKNKIDYKLVSIINKDSILVKLIKKLFKKDINYCFEDSLYVNDVKWNKLYYENNLISQMFTEIRLKKMVFKLIKKYDFTKYNLISAHFVFPRGYIAKKIKEKYNIPYIVTAHGEDIHTLPQKSEKIKKYVLDTLKNADKVIFVSNALLNEAIRLGYDNKNSVVIPNGVDIKSFNILNKNKVKEDLKINPRKKIVGFVGSLTEVKRADKLPIIFNNICELYNEVEFVVVGDGPLKKYIQDECNRRGINVLMTGRVSPSRVPFYMNSMDVMILPSRREGYGCVVIEANACGIPVVGSNVGGIPEAIADDDRIVKDGEEFEKKFAENVVEVLNDNIDPIKLREKALNYSWDNVVENELKYYYKILDYNK